LAKEQQYNKLQEEFENDIFVRQYKSSASNNLIDKLKHTDAGLQSKLLEKEDIYRNINK